MKRNIVIAALLLLAFVLGWIAACFVVQGRAGAWANERIARSEERQAELVAKIRQRIYGPNYFHLKGISADDDARLERFDPATSKGSITMSYVGGMGGADLHIQIEPDGGVRVTNHEETHKVITLDQSRCSEFFMRVITSGLLNYSDGIVEIKQDLARPDSMSYVTDMPVTEIRISVPELGIDKFISIYAPQVELRNYPDIVELQRVTSLENEILSFVPEGDPVWK